MAAALPKSKTDSLDIHVECPICLSTFTDPRVLPCLHTFCRDCVDNLADIRSQRPFPCPSCKRMTPIPPPGDGGSGQGSLTGAGSRFPVNFFVNSLIDSLHKVKSTPSLMSMPRGDRQKCSYHPNMDIDMFCLNCETPVCAKCFLSPTHRGHKDKELSEVAQVHKVALEKAVQRAASHKQRLQQVVVGLQTSRGNMKDDLEKANQLVKESVERLCREARQYGDQLLNKIEVVRQSGTERIEASLESTQMKLAHTSSIQSYVEQILEEDNSLEILRHQTDIEEKIAEQERAMVDIAKWEPSYQQLTPERNYLERLLGDVGHCCEKGEVSQPVVTQIVRLGVIDLSYKGDFCVSGVVAVDNWIYVSHHSDNKLWVYKPEGGFVGHIPVPNMPNPQGMVLVDRNPPRMVLSEFIDCKLHFISINRNHTLKSHDIVPLAYRPNGLSVNIKGQIVVANNRDKRICVHKSDGIQIKTVDLAPGIGCLVHALDVDRGLAAVDFESGTFVVHNDRGARVGRYGDKHGAQALGSPQHAIRDSYGQVLVSDWKNNRLHLLSKELEHVKHFVDPIQRPWSPCRLFLDETAERLYVAHKNEQIRIFRYTTKSINAMPNTVTHVKFEMSAPGV